MATVALEIEGNAMHTIILFSIHAEMLSQTTSLIRENAPLYRG
jgi:hypothetical protein